MSFIHYTYVGHFDPATVSAHNLAVATPLDPARVTRLLAEYATGVAGQVILQDGYARCQWAPASVPTEEVIEFAYRLARKECCLAVEQGRKVTYPPQAAQAQGESLERVSGQIGLAADYERQARAHCDLLSDIIGDPFRPVVFCPEWSTETALALARQMCESRDFSVMPILADALQDAGCDDAEILDHCRGPGTHVRGCWVVDLVLGKE